MHLPVDHHLRGFYRVLVFVTGVYLVLFGIASMKETSGMGTFDQPGERVWGLTTNPAFARLTLATGILVLVGVLVGRNIDAFLNMALGGVFMLAGLAMLAFLRTDSNYLAFSMTNVNVSFVIGIVLATAGMYGMVSRPTGKVK